MDSRDMALMKGGQMMIVIDGRLLLMEAEVITPDGVLVRRDGTLVLPDGTLSQLEEDEAVIIDRALMREAGM